MLNLPQFLFKKYSHMFDDSLKSVDTPSKQGRGKIQTRRDKPVEETVEILETLRKEDLLPDIIRSEVNSLIYPVFALQTKDLDKIQEIEYKSIIQRNGQKLEVIWSVSSNPKFGFPGPFEKQVFRAIEKIISLLPLPIQNPIKLGSFTYVAKIMRLKVDKNGDYPGHVYKDIKDALKKIKVTAIESKGTFYHKGKRQWLEDIFSLYDRVISKGEELPNGTVAETNYLILGSWYLENINARYVRPLNYTYLESLSSELTRRFYELFGTKFYFVFQSNIPFIRYKYSTLCQLLPVAPQKHYSAAKRNFDPHHQQLIETGFFEKVIWPKEKISKDISDWFIYYYPGPRAKEEYEKQGDYQIGDSDFIQLMETNIVEPLQLSSKIDKSNFFNSAQQDIFSQLINFGISEKVARERVEELDPDFIANWLKAIEEIPNLNNKRGYLTKALKEKWFLPESYEKWQKQQETIKAKQTQEEKEKREKIQQEQDKKEELNKLYESLSENQKQKVNLLIDQKFQKYPIPLWNKDPAGKLYQAVLQSIHFEVLENLKENQNLLAGL